MPAKRILVVDADDAVHRLTASVLTPNGFRLVQAASGRSGLDALQHMPPDLMLLDILLPDTSGLDVCREVKTTARYRHIPIMMMGAGADEADIVAALELGADDFVEKPFRPRVLLARVRASLRRPRAPAQAEARPVRARGLLIDPGRHEVRSRGQPVPLTPTEFRVLQALAARPGWVFKRDQIVDAVHGGKVAVTDRAVDAQVSALRQKLGPTAALIETVRGVGYRFRA